ncbi:hypothetical protein [Paraburkholderia sp. RL17-373-BIF-A]|uniref:hypothetical protein n=1 Tax=Paraburkholderia sp. RL17-373-BIF-A TaxID=3031629 RepID=UPI0038B72DD7
MATLLSQTEATGDHVVDRDMYRAEQAQELAEQLREAASDASSLDDVLEHISQFLTPSQHARAKALLQRHDYRSLGKLLCDVHEQLVKARVAKVAPRRVVLWDEVQ